MSRRFAEFWATAVRGRLRQPTRPPTRDRAAKCPDKLALSQKGKDYGSMIGSPAGGRAGPPAGPMRESQVGFPMAPPYRDPGGAPLPTMGSSSCGPPWGRVGGRGGGPMVVSRGNLDASSPLGSPWSPVWEPHAGPYGGLPGDPTGLSWGPRGNSHRGPHGASVELQALAM